MTEENENIESSSSAERALRHGEIKLLKTLKRQHDKEEENKKRKILRLETWTIESSDETMASGSADVRDIDFRLTNNHAQLQVCYEFISFIFFKVINFFLKVYILSESYNRIYCM